MQEENLTLCVSNTRFNTQDILWSFEKTFIKKSSIRIKDISPETDYGWRQYILILDDGIYTLHIKFKSVTSGGWKEKPQIRRIQISRHHLDNIVDTKKNELTLLAGYVVFKDTPLFCFWNPKRYITHKTVCSCYVNVSSINKAFIEGYYSGHDSGKEVYICNSVHLQQVIKDFIANNYISDFKW